MSLGRLSFVFSLYLVVLLCDIYLVVCATAVSPVSHFLSVFSKKTREEYCRTAVYHSLWQFSLLVCTDCRMTCDTLFVYGNLCIAYNPVPCTAAVSHLIGPTKKRTREASPQKIAKTAQNRGFGEGNMGRRTCVSRRRVPSVSVLCWPWISAGVAEKQQEVC